MIRRLYPGGKRKAFNISYDDGVLQDIRFVKLLNRYGLKGTFNLNSGLMHQSFTWTHDCGMEVRRIQEAEAVGLYEGHEIASHSYSHPYFDEYPEAEILKELASDKFFLEKLFGREVSGYATPFYFYSDMMADCVRHCGFSYARISEESNDYSVPEDFYRWRGSKFHWDEDLEEFVDGFLMTDMELAMCQIVGHSYDLDVMDMWDKMEHILQKVSNNKTVWAVAHTDLVRYLGAMKQARITEREIVNPGSEPLWFEVNGNVISVPPKGTYFVREEEAL